MVVFGIGKDLFFKSVLGHCVQDHLMRQGVVALGGHFATFCQEVEFYEANHFFHY